MKRFTETEKWKDPWFRKLSPGAKLAFFYIIENCDNSGLWSGDKELAEFSIGMQIPWEKVLEAFGNRVVVLPGGEWVMTKFVYFQFGDLSSECKPHQQVIRLIENHRVSKGYPKGIHTLEEKEKDKDKDKKGSPEGKRKSLELPTPPDILLDQDGFDAKWADFIQHRKEIKEPMTALAAKGILNQLSKRPRESVPALDMAIRRGWRGFEWEWFDKEKPKHTNGHAANGTAVPAAFQVPMNPPPQRPAHLDR